MTKRDLLQELARARGISAREARVVVDALLGSIERALTDGQSVTLRSFGRFEVRKRVGRRLLVPGSGREMRLPARLAPVFQSARILERRLSAGSKASAQIGPEGDSSGSCF